VSFTGGDSYAYYEPLGQCEDGKLSFEFATTQTNGLLLYSGPMYDTSAQNAAHVRDFLSVEMKGGFPEVRVNMGDEELRLSVDGKDGDGGQVLPDRIHWIQVMFM